MPRVSREQMQANRAAMVDAGGRLLREGGPHAVTVEAVSARAGMTHGSFHKQFRSREAFLVEALEHASDQRRDVMDDAAARRPDRTLGSFADVYLSAEHRDAAGDGCVVAALAGHVACDTDGPLRDGFLRAVDVLRDALTAVSPDHDEQAVLADVALLVGALQLARATAGTPRSDAVLDAARRALTESTAAGTQAIGGTTDRG